MGYRDYSTAKGHIVDSTGHGDFTTIQAAINAASSGQTIFVRPGTYTENPILKAGVDIFSFSCDATTPNVTISGKCSYSGSGRVSMSGILFTTNSDNAIEITGSNPSSIVLTLCSISATTNVAINMTSSNSGSNIFLRHCEATISGTATYFTVSGAGTLYFSYCDSGSSGGTGRSTFSSSGVLTIDYSTIGASLTMSGTSNISADYSILFANVDSGGIVLGGSGGFQVISHCNLSGQVVVNNSTAMLHCSVSSAQTNALTGSGTLIYAFISFFNSSGHNVSTETPFTTI